jgi:hypothetical protein
MSTSEATRSAPIETAQLRRESISQGIFGAFDGMTSALGVIAATLIAGSTRFIVLAVFGVAIAATVGMAAGEYLSDPKRSLRRAMVMGAATLVGAVAPGLPFLVLGKWPAAIGCLLITVTLAGLIAHFRQPGGWRAYATTFGILGAVAALTAAVSIVVGRGA